MYSTAETSTIRQRFAPTFLVLGIAIATVAFYLAPMYFAGNRYEDQRQFLRNYRSPNEFEAFAECCMIYSRDSTEANDVIFLGDSSCRCDLRTLQFQDETGLKAYNLGSMGLLGMEGNVQIFRNYLKHHPKPKVVVLSMLPNAVGVPCSEFTPPLVKDVKPRFLWSYSTDDGPSRPPGSLIDVARLGIRSTYGSMVGGIDHFAGEPIPLMRGTTFRSLKELVDRERGFYQVRHQHAIPPRKRLGVGDPFRVCDEFEKGVAAIARDCEENRILLLVRLSPHSGEGMERSPTLRTWADRFEAGCPSSRVLRPEVLLYDAVNFADENHCNAKGVEKFTSEVAVGVKEALNAWDRRPTSNSKVERVGLRAER